MTSHLLDTIERQTGPEPVATLIVLHGLGADGTDFLPFCEELDLSPIGAVRFLFPNAPVQPVTINGGYPMRAWYDIRDGDLVRREDEQGLRESKAAIDALIDHERARGIDASRIVLAGFSQGCAMTLLAGLCHEHRLAGLAGLSGYLPLSDKIDAERSPANRDVPIFLAHGQYDDVVPMARGQASRQALVEMGYAVQWHEYPMPHSVCAPEITDLNRWLLDVLA